ncbi:FAD-binding oxidoreductase [Alterinioella nitratireducens]|jgi:FAD/FMN-containing dehydrogenase|uniref:FAD-binding oxidoreductase n=1 Tax=Alterinioella nitratireducens TaxID=2735915 RepID=UPI0015568395|nr:FAD-binding oxidoreductase [Alterinioella nitratireducens]NPD19847.1 FAD-binding oxidoreductase [Alterinioella nitratireducens]
MGKVTRRGLLVGAGGAAGWIGARQFGHHLPVYEGTARLDMPAEAGFLNDASGLSRTPIHRHITLSEDPGEALIAAIRAEITEAASNRRPVNIGAARHSMGGQAIPRAGHAITFDNGMVEPDTAAQTYRAHAGARWSQVIAALDPIGFSPAVMQSNNDFGVAATFCVNAHGWPVPFGPMGATVRSFRMVLPTGDLVTCSRRENAEIFNLTMGGYGLTGAIIDMEVDMIPNRRLQPSFETMPAEAFSTAFTNAVATPAVSMAYGRLNVGRARFFEDALMITYRATEDQADLPPAEGSGLMARLASRIYRWQLGNEPMKRLRWWTETTLGPALGDGPATRNSLINEPVVTLDDRDDNRTDILHEYFVAPERFGDFLTACREVIPASYQEFLNVTLRHVAQDDEAVLSYARTPRIAAVMSFSQEMTQRGEADMARMTRNLIDRIVEIGGSYYLPYRPHATIDQLTRSYPRAEAFAAAKRELDPQLIFRNTLWDSYLEAL